MFAGRGTRLGRYSRFSHQPRSARGAVVLFVIPSSPIPFEEFMRRALHDPERGYYARNINRVGRGGDFTTAPELSPAPALAIARWAARALRETRCHDLIEIGPGTGALAQAVLRNLPWHLRLRTRLHLVETSQPLAAIQRRVLGRSATWHPSPAAALAACRGRAVIFSNELVDAFPVRRFRKTMDGWSELHVHRDATGLVHESYLPRETLPDSSSFAQPHRIGQIIEVHQSYRDWLSTWMPGWHAGRALTIDYGDTAERLYDRRPQGTLRAYLLQQRIEGSGIYQNPGRQDLTADVNFTDLIAWCSPWTDRQNLTDLAGFIAGHDAGGRNQSPTGIPEESYAAAFKVLEQHCRT